MAWYHQVTAKILEAVPGLQEWLTVSAAGHIPKDLPEQPFSKPEVNPDNGRLMLITTGGVHTPTQTPFDMSDSRGDTSFRLIPREQDQFSITHDYYNHDDADEDINCLFPLPLVRQLINGGLLKGLTEQHVSLMGHIEDPLLPELIHERLPELWNTLADFPDLILLSPG